MKLQQLVSNYEQAKSDLEMFLNTLDELEEPSEIAYLEEYLNSAAQNFEHSREEMEIKLNGWCWVLFQLSAQVEYNRAQAKRFECRARVVDNRIKSMKHFLAILTQRFGKMQLQDYTLSPRKPSKKVEIDYSFKEELLISYQKELPIEQLIDKSAIKADLLNGTKLPFAKLVDGEPSILIK